MAPPTPNTDLADQLVASLLPHGMSVPKLRKYKDGFSRKLRAHNYGRTNQFDVAERLDGLQEKFQILNNDELADALRARLEKLKHHPEKWLPDILDLMIRLSDDPTTMTKIEWLTKVGTLPAMMPTLTWAEIDADDPVDRKDQIWKVAEYSDLSSDDDIAVVVAPTTQILGSTVPIANEQDILLRAKLEPIDPDVGLEALNRLKADQFWQNVSNEPFELTELQVIREVLFLIQGLPTALFWKVGNGFEIDQRYRLRGSSRETFVDVLFEFSQIAIRLDLLRNFVQKAQSVRFMQTLRFSLEEMLQTIGTRLSSLEQNLLAVDSEAASTILQLHAKVNDIVELTAPLANFVKEHQSRSDTIEYLDVLFDQVCQIQASGDESGFQSLSKLFFQCFEVYFRPVRLWMDQGKLEEDQAATFIKASPCSRDLSSLWQKWYALTDDSAPNRCPRLLQPVKAQILRIGKTVVFLQFLNASYETFDGSLMFNTPDLTSANASSLLPFSELLATSVQDFVESRLQNVTSILRDHLGSNCGLWRTLDALDNIYFGRSGHATDLVDTKVFTAIDRCNKNWNDRFLLGDLLQTAFEPIESVEAERLALKVPSQPSRNMPHRRQSVKLLHDFRIQYALHWSVANVITPTSLTSYQRISTFLTQIRRARYMLERRSLSQVRAGNLNTNPQERNLNQLLHHNLLLFLNTLYSHLTTLVIVESCTRLRQDLTNAPDIDAMITTHNQYCKDLEEACLTSKKLKPIHDETVSIIDLCIRFSDLNNPNKLLGSADEDADTDADAHSYISATSHQRRQRRRRSHHHHHQKEIEDTSSDEEEEPESDNGEGYSTFIVPDESTLLDQLRKIKAEFEKHRSFVVAGLASIGRVGAGGETGEKYWEVLAGRLDWRKGSL